MRRAANPMEGLGKTMERGDPLFRAALRSCCSFHNHSSWRLAMPFDRFQFPLSTYAFFIRSDADASNCPPPSNYASFRNERSVSTSSDLYRTGPFLALPTRPTVVCVCVLFWNERFFDRSDVWTNTAVSLDDSFNSSTVPCESTPLTTKQTVFCSHVTKNTTNIKRTGKKRRATSTAPRTNNRDELSVT